MTASKSATDPDDVGPADVGSADVDSADDVAETPKPQENRLTLFASSADTPRLEPAPRDRDWMDRTPQRFAYRCLPLAMANAHGWHVLNPVGFSARWTGGPREEHVEIAPDGPHTYLPKSMFGHGTITWHTGGVFRSPPGVSLWVTGPPNVQKHGIAPLTGVVETDWAPYSFTMNWRFTAPDIWVRFDRDEPFCFLMPIRTDLAESLRPEIRPMTEDEDLTARFRNWSAQRRAWSAEKKIPGSQAARERWQKLYFKGLEPDGTPGAGEHRTKVKIRPFVDRRRG